MGQVLHVSATTTEAVRRAIQHSQESLRALAKRYGINQKTVAKWKRRTSVTDRPTGPKEARSTVLSIEKEAIVVAFRKHTLLPLDDCLYALQPSVPHLTRSSLNRCLQRHGISQLPQVEGEASVKRKFKAYPIGGFLAVAAAREPMLSVLAVFHPGLPDLHRHPIISLPPLLDIHGDVDHAISLVTGRKLVAAAKRLGGVGELVIFPNEGHAFDLDPENRDADEREDTRSYFHSLPLDLRIAPQPHRAAVEHAGRGDELLAPIG